MRLVALSLVLLAMLPSLASATGETPTVAWLDMLNDLGYFTKPGRMTIDEANGVLYQVGSAWGYRGPDRKRFGGAFVAKYSLEGHREWLRLYDDELPGYGYGVTAGPDGNVYVAGVAPGTEATGTDSVLMALRPDGSVRWTRRTEDAAIDGLFTVAVQGDRVLVGGSLYDPDGATECEREETAFAMEYDTAGRQRFYTRWGDPSIITSVTFGPGGNAVVAGGRGRNCENTSASASTGAFVSRLDRRGMVLRTDYAPGLGAIDGIAFDRGALYLLGSQEIKLPRYEGGTAAVARMGRDGVLQWTRALTLGDKPIEGSTIAATNRGIAVAGSTDNGLDTGKAAVVTLRTRGRIGWRWEVPDSRGYSHSTGVVMLDSGDVVLGGFASGRIGKERPFGRGSVWLARLRPE